jgi:acyl phosphate:glycerol-3-phosphate acyltransferase
VGQIVLCLLIGYVVGSIPTAYLLVRWKSRIDIRNAGSGNVGTLNSFVVTRSWFVGSAVLIIDIIKGGAAVLLGGAFGGGEHAYAAIAGAAAVGGHIAPVWLRLRGGKGLATAAGAMAMVFWPAIPLWLMLYWCAHAIIRSIDPSTFSASCLVLVLAAVLPRVPHMAWLPPYEDGVARLFVVCVMAIIVLRHIGPLREYIRDRHRLEEESQR